jgi:UDP-N-acetylglucosamine 2-epimerase (non-hydrolysing)
VAHVEAGLRSGDRAMPEEINRILTDAVSTWLFVTEESGRTNLLREGVGASRIHLVGNVMIDTLMDNLTRTRDLDTLSRLGLEPRGYAVLTLHRPSNVDDPRAPPHRVSHPPAHSVRHRGPARRPRTGAAIDRTPWLP